MSIACHVPSWTAVAKGPSCVSDSPMTRMYFEVGPRGAPGGPNNAVGIRVGPPGSAPSERSRMKARA